jgi:copper oxidase (laccase) domain-containing protein
MEHRQTLADDIMAALLRANEEEDFEVAEHLLQALEAITRREETEEQVSDTYLQLAHSLGFKREDK